MSKRASREILDSMVRAYEGGLGQREAAAKFGYSQRTCARALKRAGKSARENRKYTLNENFFDVINSEETAYWLGMIATDGCLHRGQVILFLAEKDIGHIEKFKKALNSEHPIKTRIKTARGKKYKSVGMEIASQKLVAALNQLGVTKNKSLTIKPPKDIPPEYIPAFWLGAFDGDGGLSLCHSDKKDWTHIDINLSFYGNEAMVTGFSDFVSQQIKTSATPHKRKGVNVFYVHYGGVGMPQKVIKMLYRGATIYLDRKKILADCALLLRNRKPKRLNFTKEQLEAAHDKFGNWHEAARHLGISIGTIGALAKRLGASRTKWRRK